MNEEKGAQLYLMSQVACLGLPARSAMTRFAFLTCFAPSPLSLLPMLLLPCLPTAMTKFRCFFPPPPPLLLFALNLPCRLAAVADALLVMVNSDLLHLLLHGYHTIADAIVPDGWHTSMATLVECTGIFLPPSFHRDVE
jgi:hypothetical protein